MFFEEYMNFETHYLSHCRVIPLQRFRKSYTPPAARIRVKGWCPFNPLTNGGGGDWPPFVSKANK